MCLPQTISGVASLSDGTVPAFGVAVVLGLFVDEVAAEAFAGGVAVVLLFDR